MKQNDDRKGAGRAAAPRPRERFRIQKLEERIAPVKGGNKTKNCVTGGCGGFTSEVCGGTSY